MQSNEMIRLINQIENKSFVEIAPERIKYFQKTTDYDTHTHEVIYDDSFEKMIQDLEAVLNCQVYRPTAKKILNSWYSWAVKQQTSAK